MMMRKIVLTGPESSGKTVLTQQLATHFQADWLPEYARFFLENLNRPYLEADLIDIARGQLQKETEKAQANPPLLFCDTSLLVIHVWGLYKYGRSHPWIKQQLQANPAHLYLLCRPDLPWQPDPLREHADITHREALFALYQTALDQLQLPYAIIAGQGAQRLAKAIAIVEEDKTMTIKM